MSYLEKKETIICE